MKSARRGQSLVEFALIVPLIILLILGIVECSYYLYSYNALENMTRRASEWAYKSPPSTPTQADDATTDKCAALIKIAAIDSSSLHTLTPTNVQITYPAAQVREVGTPIEVRVQYTTSWLTPLGRTIFGPQLTFDFRSRRTIGSTSAPVGLRADCS